MFVGQAAARVPLFVAAALVLIAAKSYGQIPTADDVFRRYTAASGGEAAIRAVKTRVMTGELITADGGRAPLEILEAAPNRFVRILESPVSGHSENGFDGATAWTKNARGTREVSGPEVGMLLREHHLYRPAELRHFYSSITAPRADTLERHVVYVIVGTTPDSVLETLYFDRENGLLVGWDVSIAGTSLRTRVDDFRRVDGLTLAFRTRRSRADFSWTEEMRLVEHPARLDSARFTRPAP